MEPDGLDRRKHAGDGVTSFVRYSACGAYRYDLWRRWNADAGAVLFIMLNPSKADEFRNDPTVERCERRVRAMGYGAMGVVNIFAWRDTDPRGMKRAPDPVGPANDAILRAAAAQADLVIPAWGAHGNHRGRGHAVAQLLRADGIQLHHLGITKQGHPRHPLYVSYDTQPVLWDPR